MTYANYVDDLALLAITSAQAGPLLYSLEYAAEGIGFVVNANKTEFVCFKGVGISTLSSKPWKLVDQFTYFGSNISSTESDFIIHLGETRTAIDRLLKI